jgi:hypothetical protein
MALGACSISYTGLSTDDVDFLVLYVYTLRVLCLSLPHLLLGLRIKIWIKLYCVLSPTFLKQLIARLVVQN